MIIAVKSVNEVGNIFADVEPMDFSDMGLMEATQYCQEMINESWNNLTFGIMAEEYKYLYENGEELIYEEESIKDKASNAIGSAKTGLSNAKDAAGAKIAPIKEKIINLVKNFISMVSGLVNKAISTIRAHAISGTSKVSGAITLSKKQFLLMAKEYDEANWRYEILDVRCKYGFTVDPFKLGQESNRMITSFDKEIGEIKSAQDVVKELTRDFDDMDDKDYFTPEKVADCVYNGFKAIGKGILDLKKNADKVANEAIKKVKSEKPDNLSQLMENYRKAQKQNINTISGMLTVYNIYAKQCVSVVKALDKEERSIDAGVGTKKANRIQNAKNKETARTEKRVTNMRGDNDKGKGQASNLSMQKIKSAPGNIKKKLFKEKKAREAAEK